MSITREQSLKYAEAWLALSTERVREKFDLEELNTLLNRAYELGQSEASSTIAEQAIEIARLRSVLELIAASPRADGTYNRCREACEQLANEALAKENTPLKSEDEYYSMEDIWGYPGTKTGRWSSDNPNSGNDPK